jgi:hypothetical protein
MKFKYAFIVLVLITTITFSCTKGSGPGGRASIRGKVFARNYSNSFIINDSGFVGGVKVYIKYGNQPGIGDNTDTDQNGEFYFNYLREGKYTLVVYSKQLQNNTLDSAIIQEVEIKNRKEELNVPRFEINTLKN